MKKLFFLSACSLTVFIACKQPDTVAVAPVSTFSIDSVRQEIAAVNEKFDEAFVKGDSAAMVSLYHSQAEIYGPNMPKMDTKMMASGITGIPAMGIKKMVLTSTEVTGGPEGVTEIGVYEMGDGSKVIDKGKYIVLWKKEDGKWKLFRDIWNSDNPPPPAPGGKK